MHRWPSSPSRESGMPGAAICVHVREAVKGSGSTAIERDPVPFVGPHQCRCDECPGVQLLMTHRCASSQQKRRVCMGLSTHPRQLRGIDTEADGCAYLPGTINVRKNREHIPLRATPTDHRPNSRIGISSRLSVPLSRIDTDALLANMPLMQRILDAVNLPVCCRSSTPQIGRVRCRGKEHKKNPRRRSHMHAIN